MTFPRARLTVSVLLFAAWLGYLLLLVLMTRHTIVLSRPQFLVSDLWVLAEVTGEDRPDRKAKVLELFWYRSPADLKLKDQTITVANLPEAGPQGYIGPGKYMLALQKKEAAGVTMYVVAAIPTSPGYDYRSAAFVNVMLVGGGPNAKRVAQLAHEHLGIDQEEAEARLGVIAGGGVTMLARGVPRERAMEFVHALGEIDAKDRPQVDFQPYDIRIYPWTPATKEQIEELVAAR
jgi:hypothetical protein